MLLNVKLNDCKALRICEQSIQQDIYLTKNVNNPKIAKFYF